MAVPSEICGESPLNEPEPIVSRFENSVKEFPGNLAIVCPHQPADLYGLDSLPLKSEADDYAPYLRWSYDILSRSVTQLKKGLIRRGAASEVVLFSFCESQVESVISMLAAYSLGWVHVPIGPDSLSNLQEVQQMVTVVTTSIKPSKSILLVGEAHRISQVNELHFQTETIKICCCDEYHEPWESFGSFVGRQVQLPEGYQSVTLPSQENSVFFTSGTSSFPKACLINAGRWFHALEPSLSLGSVAPGDRVSVAVPVYHAFGYICTVMTLLRGSCVILIGPKFSPQGMETALKLETCTHVAMVPTMAHTLLQMAEDRECKVQSLKSMVFAGMTVSTSIIQKCHEVLGISLIENFYGMTEGVFISTGPVEDPSTITLNHAVSVGTPVSGAMLRVCDVDSHSPVPIGARGVLHFSGSTMIEHYLNGDSEDFYDSENRRWFITGDQAFMGPDKRLYIVGRHKDMIVRGGENLSPSKIEEVLIRKPELLALEPQVVAGDDAIAGEVPVVVTRDPAPYGMKDMMHETIREHLDVRYLPRAYISLDSLGLSDFPRAASGKMQKAKLRRLVADFIQSESSGSGNEQEAPRQLSHNVITVWSRLLGIQASQLDINMPISHLADSILMLSARAKIKSEIGISVCLEQWLAAPTIAEQIKALDTPAAEDSPKESENVPKEFRSGPPSTEDMVHLGGDVSAFNATKEAVEKAIADQGFAWEDVADVFPCTDFINILCQSRVINTWNIRTTIVSQNANVKEIRAALEQTLLSHPLMLSYIVTDNKILGEELGLYVTMRHIQKVLDECILDYGVLDTLAQLRKLTMNYPFQDHAMLPGPLFRCLVVFVRETNTAAVITNAAHAILDVTYHSLFHEDIDRALGGQPRQTHPSFKTWAETYHILRRSPEAASTVKFHARYLTGLQDHTHVLWPHPTSRLSVSPERVEQDGHVVIFAAPSFIRLQKQYPMLTTPIILKAALALMIILHTNHTHALFLNLEAQRARFPFVNECPLIRCNPEAADVAGPTFGGVLNLVEFQPTETVLEYLLRIQTDQKYLTKHASVPWHELSHQTRHPIKDIIPTVAESIIFNWMPGLGPAALGQSPFQNMAVKQTHIRTKLGMLASAGAGGADGSQILLFLQGALANVSSMWVERAAQEMKSIALWLADDSSRHRQVGEFTKHIEYD